MKPFRVSFVAPVLALLALLSAASIVRAQSTDERLKVDAVKDENSSKPRVPLATDWSHHHLIYSNAQAIANSTSPKAKSLQENPRFQQALARRNAMVQGHVEPSAAELGARALRAPDSLTTESEGLTKDWTSSLTTGGTVGDEQYPAKFSFNINAAPSCTGDFAVFNNNQASGNHSTGFVVDAEDFGFFYGIPAAGAIIKIDGISFTATATTGDVGGVGAPAFYFGTSATAAATNLVAAIKAYAAANPTTFTYTASNTGFGGFGGRGNASSFIIVTDTTGGAAGNATTASPANCFPFFGGCTQQTPHPNFSFFSGTFFGGRGGTVAAVANLIGLNYLYSGTPAGACTGRTTPNVMFAYGVSTEGGVTSTSPALSADGTQVAVVETTASCVGASGTCAVGSYLELVKWAAVAPPGAPITASGMTTVKVPTVVANSAYRGCTAPCMTTLKFSTTTDSNSAPFIDYTNDAIYVGDDAGALHRLAGVFVGTPSVSWSSTVDSGFALTGPVFDITSGNVYVADANGVLSTILATNGGLEQQVELDGSSTGYPIPDPPIVDGSAETVTVFESNDNTGFADLYQFTICTQPNDPPYAIGSSTCTSGQFTSSSGFPIGPAGVQMHDGDFDNTYYSGTYANSYLYFCGKDPSGTVDSPAIERATFDATGVLYSVDTAFLDVTAAGTTAGTECSPMTEVYNGSTDYMFFSVQGGGVGANCGALGGGAAGSNPSGGCVMSIIVHDDASPTVSSPTAMPTAVTASIGEPGGASGIIIDNVSSSGQASSVYFSPLTMPTSTANGNCASGIGCAVKATQSALQ